MFERNIRYGKFFHAPRQIVKRILAFIYPLIIKKYPLPKVLTIEETIQEILISKKSIVRFGDGEFLYLIDKINLPFQKYDQRLANLFKEILISNETGIMVGLPIGYHSLKNLEHETKLTWKSQIAWIYPRLIKYLVKGKIYGNASMTRLYMDYDDKSKSDYLFSLVKKIWDNRDVLLIEGEKSRLGAGNDLFSNVKSIRRILGPYHNAFSEFDNLLAEAIKYPSEFLVLVAMGPTAKPIAFHLAQFGYQAVDIGNIDVEYEWYLRGVSTKIKIPGKYTSEAKGGRTVEDISDEKYESQIVARFLNV